VGNADGEEQEKDDSLLHKSFEVNESLVKAKVTDVRVYVCVLHSPVNQRQHIPRVNVNTTISDSLDARLFPSVVLSAAPAVTMDDASSLLMGSDCVRRRGE